MKRILTVLLLLLPCSIFASIHLIDDTQQQIILQHPAQRIVSLIPHATEILFAIGAGKQVIAVDTASDYPAAVKTLPKIMAFNNINIEAILALHPDLIIAYGVNPQLTQLKIFQKFNIPVYFSNPQKIIYVARTMQDFGVMTNTQETANRAAAQFIKKYQDLKKIQHQTYTVFYELWNKPLLTINQHNIISEVINLCGGHSVFADAPGLVPQVTLEAVIAANPQIIIADEQIPHWQDVWLKWPQLQAVKSQHLIGISTNLLQRPGPRLMEGAEKLCERFS